MRQAARVVSSRTRGVCVCAQRPASELGVADGNAALRPQITCHPPNVGAHNKPSDITNVYMSIDMERACSES